MSSPSRGGMVRAKESVSVPEMECRSRNRAPSGEIRKPKIYYFGERVWGGEPWCWDNREKMIAYLGYRCLKCTPAPRIPRFHVDLTCYWEWGFSNYICHWLRWAKNTSLWQGLHDWEHKDIFNFPGHASVSCAWPSEIS